MHTLRHPTTRASLYLRVMVPLVPGRGARGCETYPRELPPWEPRVLPVRAPAGRPMGTYQRAAGYALQQVPQTDPLRGVKVHTRALAAEALVQVHAAAARRSLARLHFTDRQITQLLRAARRPQPMRGATSVLTVIDEVPDGIS